ncbi:MAG: GNAT family N-acetyltransferase, partial [Spirochaetes bacterium]|nr:GNAT family N-acetyltransferase [Spirochaetota bacterium]
RYWGTKKFYNALHFNLCYYAPIDWAIKQGIPSFDPGIGSPHKIRRGFQATSHYSYHYFRNPLMQQIFQQYIGQFNDYEQQNIDFLNTNLPIKR